MSKPVQPTSARNSNSHRTTSSSHFVETNDVFRDPSTDQTSELITLRDFNAKLLERISEFRRRNFELSKSEELLRSKELTLNETSFELEKIRSAEMKLKTKLAKITDESWAKDLEIASLKSLAADASNENSNVAGLREIEEQHLHELESLKETNQVLNQQLTRNSSEVARLEKELQTAQIAQAEALHSLRSELSQELRKRDQSLNDLKTSYEVKIATIRELETSRTENLSQLEQATSLLAALEKEVEGSRNEILSVKKNAEQSLRDLTQKSERDVEAARVQSQDRIRTLETETNRLKSDFESKIRDSQSRMGLEIETLNKNTSEREARVRQLEFTSSDQATQLQAASARENSLEKEIESIQRDLDLSRLESAQALAQFEDQKNWQLEQARRREDEANKSFEGKLTAVRREHEQVLLRIQAERDVEIGQISREMSEIEKKRKLEFEESNRVDTEQRARIRDLEGETADKSRQIMDSTYMAATLKKEIDALRTELQTSEDRAAQTLWESNQQHSHQVEMIRRHEANLTGELATLRQERAAIEKRFHEVSERANGLKIAFDTQKNEHRIELRNLKNEAEQALNELQAQLKTRLQSDFQSKFEVLLAENLRVSQLLEVRDNSAEIERKELQKRQVQLSVLEQQLRQSADLLKTDKSEILKLSKQLATELQHARTVPGPGSARQAEERSHTVMTIINGLNRGERA